MASVYASFAVEDLHSRDALHCKIHISLPLACDVTLDNN